MPAARTDRDHIALETPSQEPPGVAQGQALPCIKSSEGSCIQIRI